MALERLQLGTAPDPLSVWFAAELIFHPRAATQVDPLPFAVRTAGNFAGCGLGPEQRRPYQLPKPRRPSAVTERNTR